MTPGFAIPVGVRPACLVCGDERSVRMGLMRHREPDAQGGRYSSGWRCVDHAACRSRFEAAFPGEPWPLEEGAR